MGIGVGISLGSMSPFSDWAGGLPQQLGDLGLSDTAFQIHADSILGIKGDTGQIAFAVQRSPDIYNMMFPITVYYGRLYPDHRFKAALTFSMLSKEYDGQITFSDSSGRHIDFQQTLAFYSLTAQLTYGKRIAERYFSVDNIDRTDAIIGISVSPWVGLNRTSSVSVSDPSDPRLSQIAAVLPQFGSVSASGLAFGWQAGLATIHHNSARGGIEAEITYTGLWYTNFKSGAATVTGKDIGAGAGGSDVNSPLSYYSSRLGITISLFRKTK